MASYPSVSSLQRIPENDTLLGAKTSGLLLNEGRQLSSRYKYVTDILRQSKVTVYMRRSVYFLMVGMLVYLLSWSSVLCRVTRGIAQYPDRMPTAVWISTLGILLFYETFIIAQCTSMAFRIRQMMAAQRQTLTPAQQQEWCSNDKLKHCSFIRAFYVQACALKRHRDSFYLSLVYFLSMPDWESIAFLAGGATIDLVSAVLYSVPYFRDDVFGLPDEQQLAEPWATMAFLLLVWYLTVTLTAWWERARHRQGQRKRFQQTRSTRKLPQPQTDATQLLRPTVQPSDKSEESKESEESDESDESDELAPPPNYEDVVKKSKGSNSSAAFREWEYNEEQSIDALLAGVDPAIATKPLFRAGRIPCTAFCLNTYDRVHQKLQRKLPWVFDFGLFAPASDTGKDMPNSLATVPLPVKLLIGFAIYVLIGSLVFFGWGFLMSQWITAPAWPWQLAVLVLAFLLFRKMYYLGNWRLRLHHVDEVCDAPLRENDSEMVHDMYQFSHYHLAALFFHLTLVALTLFLGTLNEDIDWASDYIGLKRPAYFMTADWQRVSDIQDDNVTKALLMLQASNRSDPFLGMQGATTPKIPIAYCATNSPLKVYFLYICMAWSICSAAQHMVSWYRLRHFQEKYKFRHGRMEYWVLLLAFTLVFVSPALTRYGASWKPFALAAVLLPGVALLLQVAGLGVFDLFDDADEQVCIEATEPTTYQKAQWAIRDVRAYKWVEYTLSATLMHVVVTYVGGVLSAHELVLSAGALATSMLFCNMTDAALYEGEQQHTLRKASIISIRQSIDTEMPFIFLSWFAKGVLCIALTVPWIFVSRGDYVVQPVPCS